jgi:hypothetical protein
MPAGRLRPWVRAIAIAAIAATALAGRGDAPARASSGCPNEDRRLEQGVKAQALPDCRAYELVSPGSVTSHQRSVLASPDGNALTYFTTHPAVGAGTSSYFYLARRGAGGWSLLAAGPQNVPGAYFEDECDQNLYFSPDLTRNVDEEGWLQPGEPARCKRNQEVFVPGEPNPTRNVFLRDVATDSYRLVNLTPAGVTPANAKFQDASDDFSRIFFSEEAPLTADAPATARNFYVWEDDGVRLLTVLPGGEPVAGELVEAAGYRPMLGEVVFGSGMAPVTGAVSADGSRAFFYAGGNLYLRTNPGEAQSPLSGGVCVDPQLACTVQVDAGSGPGPGGGGVFWRADATGSKVIFTAESRLTADSTAAPGKPDLYLYDVEADQLTDLTATAGPAADVRGVTAASGDLSRVYFVANGALAPGAEPGNCAGEFAATQTCGLYLAEAGSVTLVATLSRQDNLVWQEGTEPRRKPRTLLAQASPDGRYLAFTSVLGLTGYDNHDVDVPEFLNRQIFVYDAATSELACASCSPAGSRDGSLTVSFAGNYASSTPGGTVQWRVNSVLDDGSVLFDSEDPLLTADVNQARDVYRFRDRQLDLLTSGGYAGPARFRNATPSGRDVYLSTPEQLLAEDLDAGNTSIYDVRVSGGFPRPQAPPPPCAGEECRPLSILGPEATVPGSAVEQSSGRAGKRKCRAKPRRCKRTHGKKGHRGKRHQAGRAAEGRGGRR